MKINNSKGSQANSDGATIELGLFGPGIDGDAVFDGTLTGQNGATAAGTAPNRSYTLTRSVFYNTVTVAAGKKLRTDGYKLFCASDMNILGEVHNDGNSGISGGGALSARDLGGSTAGGAGGAGAVAGASGSAGSPGTNASAPAVGGAGGAGASGGLNTVNGKAGGGGGGGGSLASTIYRPMFSLTPHLLAGAQLIAGGAGGGGGGGGAGNVDAGSNGGAGGGGAGVVMIFARNIRMDTGARISATGGLGGSGAGSTGSGGGGGGGGGGGLVYLVYETLLQRSGIIEAAGGSGGTGGVQGTDTGATSGANGSPGVSGKVVMYDGRVKSWTVL